MDVQFNIYTKNNSGLSGNELNVVLADPYENKVWIGTQRDGLCYFDYETETISRIPATGNYMLSNDITDLSVAADSGLWITHYISELITMIGKPNCLPPILLRM